MARDLTNLAASVRQRLLNIARAQGQPFDAILVRYGLERMLFRLSLSAHRDRFILKGGMLVTAWMDNLSRVTRDADFPGHGASDNATLIATFSEILDRVEPDGLTFLTDQIRATDIREDLEYGGTRLSTIAMLGNVRIPITIDIGFGDALPGAADEMAFPTLLDMPSPRIRSYPIGSVIAEKFHAMVNLGDANTRMKDYYDLWTLPHQQEVKPGALDAAIVATFERRGTAVPTARPDALGEAFYNDPTKQNQWARYTAQIDFNGPSLEQVTSDIWTYLGDACERLAARAKK